MTLHILLYLAAILLAGLFFGRLAKLVHLPNITGYLIVGLLMSSGISGILPSTVISDLSIISDIALGFIAFSIGGEFKISYLKRVGITPIVITIFEAFGAVLLVTTGLIAAGQNVPFSIVLGAIAAATAPAATLMVVRQYKAKGPVTETMMTVVAMDDAAALIAFSVAVSIAQAMTLTTDTSIFLTLITPLWQIVASLLLGFFLSFLFTIPLRWFKKPGNRLIIVCGFIFLGIGLADLWGLSSLLVGMALGAGLANISNQSDHIAKITESITPPIFVMFFVLSGAALDISMIPAAGLIGIIYIVLRVIGKWGGASLSAKLMKAPKTVQTYLGLTLIPQAGVAIGLTIVAASVVPQYADVIRIVVLSGTLVYELLGPVITKIALTKAGEIVTQPASIPEVPPTILQDKPMR